MADPISIASGVITLAAFAFRSSVSLYQVVESFQKSSKELRELAEELTGFQNATDTLQNIASTYESRFSALSLTLIYCGETCQEYQKVIETCSKHAKDSRSSVRDWARLQYKGDTIHDFKEKLALYRSTITMAVTSETLRTTASTTVEVQDVRKQLEEKIEENRNELNVALQIMTSRLELASEGKNAKEDVSDDQKRLSAEVQSIKDCLAVCSKASERLKQAGDHEYEDVIVDRAGKQIIVSTTGGKLTARRVKCAVDASQVLGAMSSADLERTLSFLPTGSDRTTAQQNQSRFSTPNQDICELGGKPVDRRG